MGDIRIACPPEPWNGLFGWVSQTHPQSSLSAPEAGAPGDNAITSSLPAAAGGPTLDNRYPAERCFSAAGVQANATVSSPSALLDALETISPPLHALQIPKEILEVTEEIASRHDGCGMELSSLLYLLRVVLYLDRQQRGSG